MGSELEAATRKLFFTSAAPAVTMLLLSYLWAMAKSPAFSAMHLLASVGECYTAQKSFRRWRELRLGTGRSE